MRALLLVLLCWAVLPSIAAAAPRQYHATRERRMNLAGQPPKTRALIRRVRAVIYRVVLPDISAHDVSFEDAIKLIQQGFSERNPKHYGLGIFFKLRVPGTPRPIGEPAPPGEPAPLVSLMLHSASTAKALDALCAQVDYVWRVESYSLAILPAEDFSLIEHHPSR